MFCIKCGAQVPDESVTCPVCGADIAPAVPMEQHTPAAPAQYTAQQASQPVQYTAQQAPQQSQYTAQQASQPAPYTAQQAPAPDQYAAAQAPAAAATAKKIPAKLLIIGAAAAAAIVLIIILVIALVSSNSGNAYVYLSDRGHYQLLTNLNGGGSVDIANSRSDSDLATVVFSEDGKYIYYYTRLEYNYSGFYYGSLYRAEYGKLKEDSKNNENFIELIDSDVRLGFTEVKGGLLFRDSKNTLYFYDGKEKQRIARSVDTFSIGDDKNRLIYSSDYTLYGTLLSDIGSKTKLASDYEYILDQSDFDNILYVKSDSYENEYGWYDTVYDLYKVNFGGDGEKIAEGIRDIIAYGEGGAVYYTVDGGKSLSLYDFVEDNGDPNIKEPNRDDYAIPVYSYSSLSKYSTVTDYDGIYTSFSQPVSLYANLVETYPHLGEFIDLTYEQQEMLNDFLDEYWDNYYDGSRTMEYAAEHDPVIGGEIALIVNKYKSQANEDGYIPLTDGLQQDLEYMTRLFGSADDRDWKTMCYSQSVYNDYDWDKYNEDYDIYLAEQGKAYLREQLQNEDNDQPVYSIYCYKDGNVTTVTDNALTVRNLNGAIVYNSADSVTEKLDIDDLDWYGDVYSLFYLDYEKNFSIIQTDSMQQLTMSDSAKEEFVEVYVKSGGSLYFTETHVYMLNSVDGFYSAEISGGTVGSFTLIDGDASSEHCRTEGDVLYYFVDVRNKSGYTYGDLYRYNGSGDPALLAAEIMISGDYYYGMIRMYEDGVITAYTGHGSGGYDLTMINANGKVDDIADGVTQYFRINASTVLYISEGDLYVYDGSKRTCVAENVQKVWAREKMDYTAVA